MDRLLEKLWNFVAHDASLTLQVRLFRLFCLATGILCLGVVMPVNAVQNLPLIVHVANVVLGLLALLCYRESRRGRNHTVLFFGVAVLMMDPVWYLNGGADGSVTYFFFPMALYPMTLFRGQTRWIAALGLMINVCALLAVERFFPSLSTPFKSTADRLADLITGVFCSFVVLTVIMWVIIVNYDWERELISRFAKELGTSEANYRGVVENAKSIILRVDPRGRVTFFNKFAEELFGYQRDEIVGRRLLDTIVPSVSQKGEDLTAKIAELLRQPEGLPQHESENVRRDGRRLRIIWTYQPLYDDSHGLREILCVGADVTERAALLERLELTQRTVDSAAEQIIWTDEAARIFYANAAAAETLGYTAEELRKLTMRDISADMVSVAWDQRQTALKRDGSITFEDVQRRKDGTTLPVEVTATYLRIGDKVYTAAFIRDITVRKQAEEDVERINRQLVEISRQAGMAEVAVSVLHNVGNVLNSANISASMIADSARRSRLDSLGRVADLISQHSQDLGRFFSEDERGRKIPAFLQTLARHLNGHQTKLLKETKALISSIEHIKEIVATQQSSARVIGVVETLSLASLVEDSLRMTTPSLARHNIGLVREFQSIPPVTVDKHKALQILVNLLRNAQHACDESTQTDKQIIVRIVRRGDERVAIEVEDNGVGIAPENMTRIFSHGFTTRKDGHGFGLHSGALAAKEMGGALLAQSDGLGRGARFTLDLPLRAPADGERFSTSANQI